MEGKREIEVRQEYSVLTNYYVTTPFYDGYSKVCSSTLF